MTQPPNGQNWGQPQQNWGQPQQQGFPPNQGMPPQGMPNQGMPPQGMPPQKKGLGTGAKVGIGALALALVGGGAFAAVNVLKPGGAGTDSAAAVPSTATAYANYDLAPGAAQQVEMVRFALKFPSVRENFKLDENTDMRQQVWESMTKDKPCPTVDYEKDLKPWVGTKMGMAMLPGKDKSIVVLAASDEKKAKEVMPKVTECVAPEMKGVAFGKGFVVTAKDQATADQAVADAKTKSLAETDEFKQDFGKLGTTGMLSYWTNAEGMRQVNEESNSKQNFDAGEFRSMAGTVRFTGGNPEMSMVVKSTAEVAKGSQAKLINELPADTTVAIGIGGGSEAIAKNWEEMKKSIEKSSGSSIDTMTQGSPFKLPEDLQTLLGDDFVLSADKIDTKALESADSMAVIRSLPIGISAKTDKAKVDALVAKAQAGSIINVSGNDVVRVSTSSAYASKLEKPGAKLKDKDSFKAAVADADKANAIVYFDINAYQSEITQTMSKKDAENIKPLQAVGASTHVLSDNYQQVAIRVTAK